MSRFFSAFSLRARAFISTMESEAESSMYSLAFCSSEAASSRSLHSLWVRWGLAVRIELMLTLAWMAIMRISTCRLDISME